jgi:formylglycine-generating enzyme required for sulfatase activity
MLAVIGATWLAEIKDREAHGEEDFVRLELACSLARGIPIVPVLVDGAPMPRARDLPDDLKTVTKRNALPLVADTFEAQMGRLEREVHKILTQAGDLPGMAAPFASVKLQPEPTRPVAGVASAGTPVAAAIVTARVRWMSDEGIDSIGRWAEFKVDSVIQRLRWIEPGEFWMGSTEAERKRFAAGDEDVLKYFDDEKARHRVRMTQGFWLADTACTQALWQAVTGENPSKFTGDLQLPVEQVSWNDITQHFLPELNRRVPGLKVSVPTEAHWEYACRAGIDTAYSFGETITPEQVNFDGRFPPPGGAKGQYREKTVPVKALAANAWGLYQMHGNVWEWCADGKRTYEAGAASDPVGPQEQGAGGRVLRGGSWYSNGWNCRSADRYADVPDGRSGSIGFRLARGLADQ